ncbi:hypothetical protein [Kaistella carnis]|uniref:hypothetical protein n=1 Tax=Kaistella carnis TaxID=1241979 RepID=UPI0028AC56CB|nr:hypothetical protein [Kaistella carnis]
MKFVLFLSILLSIFSCQKRPNANIENDKCFNLKKERNAYADFKPVDKKLILDIKYPNLEFEEIKNPTAFDPNYSGYTDDDQFEIRKYHHSGSATFQCEKTKSGWKIAMTQMVQI